MKTFDYHLVSAQDFSPHCRELMKRVREDKGTMQAVRQMYPALLSKLEDDAFFESVRSSACLEGLYVDMSRVREIAAESSDERGGSEAARNSLSDTESQLAGYAHALRSVRESLGSARGISSSELVRVHDAIFAARGTDGKSSYRRRDHVRMMVDGRMQPVKVSPIAAFETPLYTGAACDSVTHALDEGGETLAIIPEFCVDLMCIRPFDEGTGRVMRLAMTALMERGGYDIGRYKCLERAFEESAADYYNALNACASGWEDGKNAYEPFVAYWLGVVHRAYVELFSQTSFVEGGHPSKSERVRLYFENHPGAHAKRDVVEACRDVSLSTIELALGDLTRRGVLRKSGAGRATRYEYVGGQQGVS